MGVEKARTRFCYKTQEKVEADGNGQKESEAADRLARSPEGNSVSAGDGLDKEVGDRRLRTTPSFQPLGIRLEMMPFTEARTGLGEALIQF